MENGERRRMTVKSGYSDDAWRWNYAVGRWSPMNEDAKDELRRAMTLGIADWVWWGLDGKVR